MAARTNVRSERIKDDSGWIKTVPLEKGATRGNFSLTNRNGCECHQQVGAIAKKQRTSDEGWLSTGRLKPYCLVRVARRYRVETWVRLDAAG